MVKVKKEAKLAEAAAGDFEVVIAPKSKSATDTDALKKVASASKKQMKGRNKKSENREVFRAARATRELYVSGFDAQIESSDIQNHFTKYGAVSNVRFIKGKKNKSNRTYAFVHYEKIESLQEATKQAKHTIKGQDLIVRLATAKRFTAFEHELFVFGLREDTTSESIDTYFSKFGALSKVNVPLLYNKTHNRGFAFVGFTEEDSLKKVLEEKEHQIDGAVVNVNENTGKRVNVNNQFIVSQLDSETTLETLTDHFSKYGDIANIVLPKGGAKRNNRGFAYVSYHSNASIDKAQQDEHIIDGKQLRLKVTFLMDKENKGVQSKDVNNQKKKEMEAKETAGDAIKEEEQKNGEDYDSDEMEAAEGSDDEMEGDNE